MSNISNVFEHVNNELLETFNYHLELAKEFIEQFKDFIEQLEENKIQEEREKITNTQKLIDEIQSMEFLNTNMLIEIAHRLELFDPEYTIELKKQIMNAVSVIEFNKLGDYYTFECIKKELVEMITDIAEDYEVSLNEIEESR